MLGKVFEFNDEGMRRFHAITGLGVNLDCGITGFFILNMWRQNFTEVDIVTARFVYPGDTGTAKFFDVNLDPLLLKILLTVQKEIALAPTGIFNFRWSRV